MDAIQVFEIAKNIVKRELSNLSGEYQLVNFSVKSESENHMIIIQEYSEFNLFFNNLSDLREKIKILESDYVTFEFQVWESEQKKGENLEYNTTWIEREFNILIQSI